MRLPDTDEILARLKEERAERMNNKAVGNVKATEEVDGQMSKNDTLNDWEDEAQEPAKAKEAESILPEDIQRMIDEIENGVSIAPVQEQPVRRSMESEVYENKGESAQDLRIAEDYDDYDEAFEEEDLEEGFEDDAFEDDEFEEDYEADEYEESDYEDEDLEDEDYEEDDYEESDYEDEDLEEEDYEESEYEESDEYEDEDLEEEDYEEDEYEESDDYEDEDLEEEDYEEDEFEEEDYEDEFEEPARREPAFEERKPKAEDRRNKVVNIHATTQLKVVLVKPERFENASEIADHLKDKRTVVINLESTNKDVARRLIDFLSGVAYAGEGKIKKVAANTYIITPYHVDIEGDLIDELENNGLYF